MTEFQQQVLFAAGIKVTLHTEFESMSLYDTQFF